MFWLFNSMRVRCPHDFAHSSSASDTHKASATAAVIVKCNPPRRDATPTEDDDDMAESNWRQNVLDAQAKRDAAAVAATSAGSPASSSPSTASVVTASNPTDNALPALPRALDHTSSSSASSVSGKGSGGSSLEVAWCKCQELLALASTEQV
jgi:hypothetical protein